jgi:hypothetical protein
MYRAAYTLAFVQGFAAAISKLSLGVGGDQQRGC